LTLPYEEILISGPIQLQAWQNCTRKNIKVEVPSRNQAPRYEDMSGGTSVHVPPNLGTKWRWVVSFTLRSLYSGKGSPVPTGWKAGRNPEPVSTWRRTFP
jgi:hypothetical protein